MLGSDSLVLFRDVIDVDSGGENQYSQWYSGVSSKYLATARELIFLIRVNIPDVDAADVWIEEGLYGSSGIIPNRIASIPSALGPGEVFYTLKFAPNTPRSGTGAAESGVLTTEARENGMVGPLIRVGYQTYIFTATVEIEVTLVIKR